MSGPREIPLGEALEVSLRFGAQADLDLFVTGPDLETVYFGNSPNRSGAVLDVDRRCDSGEPRVERVRFANPAEGTYRVGVEYARSCRFRRSPAEYRIEVQSRGLDIERAGVLSPGSFDSRALEFEFRPPASR